MDNYQRQKEEAEKVGGPYWRLLVEVISDSEFNTILSEQEKRMLSDFTRSPETVRSYKEQFTNVLGKYIGWKVYKESDLKKIKKEIDDLSGKVTESSKELQTIRDTAGIISGAHALVAYSKTFKESAAEHKDDAKTQQTYYFLSLAGFAVVAAFVFFVSVTDIPFVKNLVAEDIKSLPFSTGILAVKIFLLVFAYQISQFFRKNYGAEKHLQEVYWHRSDVLQSLHAVYEALKDNPEERAKILSAGALFAYERGETGYITTKEGAGSAGDGMVDSILASLVRGK